MLEDISFVIGGCAAMALVAGLVISLIIGDRQPHYRIWPAPPEGSAASFAFWTCFRALNATALVLGGATLVASARGAGWHGWQAALSVLAAAAFGFYLYTLWSLGRDATYCQASGLNTRGVYSWSRNPQYASAMIAYAALGAASGAPGVAALAAALVGVYALMGVVEEPWLAKAYGEAYRDYRRRVPRYFPVRRALQSLVVPPRHSAGLRAGGERRD